MQGTIARRLVDALAGARTIAAAGTAEREAQRVLAPLPELHRQGVAMWRAQMRITAQDAMLVALLEIAVLAVAGVLLARGRISPGELIAASQYVLLASGIAGAVIGLTRLVRSRAAATRVLEILDEPPMRYGTAPAPRGPRAGSSFAASTARAGGRTVLDGIDLVVPAGALVAVVGRSGSGKSLLAALAGRLVDPDEGEVLLDGVALRELGRRELRREIGYGFERPALLGETLGDAIACGTETPLARGGRRRGARGARRRLHPAACRHGYDTPLADAPMSGGEIQRMGLARTFAHARRVVVLDDVAASLDTVTEHHIGAVLTGALADRTRIVVAHRASTAARADAVIWLEDGRDPRVRRARAALARPATTARCSRRATSRRRGGRRDGERERGREPGGTAGGDAAPAALVGARARPGGAAARRLVARPGAAGVSLRAARRAGDRRRLSRRPHATGFAWLGLLALSVLVGGWATRQTFLRLATIVEPFRDELIARTVHGSLRRSTAAGAVADSAGVARLTQQVEIVREAYASVLLVVQGFVVTAVGALLGLLTLAPIVLVLVVPPLVVGLALFALALPGMARAPAGLDPRRRADRRVGRRRRRGDARRGGVRRRGAGRARCVGEHIDAQARATRELARFTALRTVAVAVGGLLPIVLILAAGPVAARSRREHGRDPRRADVRRAGRASGAADARARRSATPACGSSSRWRGSSRRPRRPRRDAGAAQRRGDRRPARVTTSCCATSRSATGARPSR